MSKKELYQQLDNPKTYTRLIYLKRKEGYGIGRTSLIKSWRLPQGYHAYLRINGIKIAGPDNYFDIPTIRKAIREVIPEDAETNAICSVENSLIANQITILEHYRYFPSNQLFNYIFTGDLCVTFDWDGDQPDKILLEETCILSKIQVEQRLNNGESLSDIDTKNKDESPTEDFSVV